MKPNKATTGAGPTPELALPADHARLFEVWESAVRATHHFLSDADIEELTPQVREALSQFTPILVLRNTHGSPYAFMGAADRMIEMLFVHADYRGQGAGKTLVRHAIAVLGATKVDVNEQNGQGLAFYEHLGFRPTGRSALDAAGRPFPILHLALA